MYCNCPNSAAYCPITPVTTSADLDDHSDKEYAFNQALVQSETVSILDINRQITIMFNEFAFLRSVLKIKLSLLLFKCMKQTSRKECEIKKNNFHFITQNGCCGDSKEPS